MRDRTIKIKRLRERLARKEHRLTYLWKNYQTDTPEHAKLQTTISDLKREIAAVKKK